MMLIQGGLNGNVGISNIPVDNIVSYCDQRVWMTHQTIFLFITISG